MSRRELSIFSFIPTAGRDRLVICLTRLARIPRVLVKAVIEAAVAVRNRKINSAFQRFEGEVEVAEGVLGSDQMLRTS